jgi:hypothetical protein
LQVFLPEHILFSYTIKINTYSLKRQHFRETGSEQKQELPMETRCVFVCGSAVALVSRIKYPLVFISFSSSYLRGNLTPDHDCENPAQKQLCSRKFQN